jgi:hypothetical protein
MNRRGAAMLELVAALVLLAMTAAMCIPLMRSIAAPLAPSMDAAGVGELAAFADAWMASEAASASSPPTPGQKSQLVWERRHAPLAVELSYQQRGERHGWFSFSCGGATVVRYVRTPQPPQTSAEAIAP